MPRAPRRILLIRLSSLGDVVHNLPLAHALREHFPSARLTWVVDDRFADLLRAEPDLDAVLAVRRGLTSGRDTCAASPRGGLRCPDALRPVGFAAALSRIRGESADVVLDPQGLLKSAVLALASRARVRIGFAPPSAREGAHLAYTHRVPVPSQEAHAVDRGLALLRGLGIEPPREPRLDLAVAEADRKEAAALLSHALRGSRVSERGPLVVLHPGARWETKLWRPKRWVHVVRTLRHEGMRVVLTRGPSDEGVVGSIMRASTTAMTVLDPPRLGVLAGVLELSDCILGVDSGPLHMAVALGRPVVMLHGPTDPRSVGPYGRPHAVIRRAVPCSPCRRRACTPHQCMATLDESSVVRAVQDALSA